MPRKTSSCPPNCNSHTLLPAALQQTLQRQLEILPCLTRAKAEELPLRKARAPCGFRGSCVVWTHGVMIDSNSETRNPNAKFGYGRSCRNSLAPLVMSQLHPKSNDQYCTEHRPPTCIAPNLNPRAQVLRGKPAPHNFWLQDEISRLRKSRKPVETSNLNLNRRSRRLPRRQACRTPDRLD